MLPKLTIAIPTYNRAKYLDMTLNAISHQYWEHKDYIEIIVSNNASVDNTDEIVQKYTKQGIPIVYYKLEKNTGLDGNISNCFIQAAGEYVWILGDDDIIASGGISAIMNYILDENEYGLIYVSSKGYDNEIPNIVIDPNNISADVLDQLSFTQKINTWFTFVSGNIINKKMFLKYRDYESFIKFYGTHVILLSWSYFMLTLPTKFLHINDRIVIVKIDNNGGYKLFEVFGQNQFSVADAELKEYPRLIRAIKRGTILYFFPLQIVRYRCGENSSFETEFNIKAQLTKDLSKYLYFWVFLYPLLVLPTYLLRPYLFCIKVFGKINRMIGYKLL